MLGTHYFSCSHFAARAKCSRRSARRWLRQWIRSLPKEQRDAFHIYPGQHIRLDSDQLSAALTAWHSDRRLTQRQHEFAFALARGCTPAEAARRAGYKRPEAGSFYNRNHPAVLRAVQSYRTLAVA